jgi:hypothetical protein
MACGGAQGRAGGVSEQELSRLKQLYEWDPWDEDLETWVHFHPEDRSVDPSDMPTYSYFHPETWDEWIKP